MSACSLRLGLLFALVLAVATSCDGLTHRRDSRALSPTNESSSSSSSSSSRGNRASNGGGGGHNFTAPPPLFRRNYEPVGAWGDHGQEASPFYLNGKL